MHSTKNIVYISAPKNRGVEKIEMADCLTCSIKKLLSTEDKISTVFQKDTT